MRTLLARLRDSFRRRTIAKEFEEEMSFHLAELERQQLGRGDSPAEARAAAARSFGNILRTREELRARAGFPRWDETWNDLKFAWRGIARRPALSCSVVLILALGLGAAATIHGLIDAVFLRPLPVPHPEQLYAVLSTEPGIPERLSRGTARRLEELLPPKSVAAYSGGGRATVQIESQPATRANTRLVNGSFFATLGVSPGAGRFLTDEDDVAGNPPEVVVLSSAWASANFGTPEAALGRKLIVNRQPVTVVGVLPPAFRDVSVGQLTELWFATALQPVLHVYGNASISSGDDRPNLADWNREERISWLQILVRVRPGVPAAVAVQRAWEPQRDDLILIHDDPREREQMKHRGWALSPAPAGRSSFRGAFHSTGWLLGGVVAVMLVLVCTNVSGLLLVRSMSRHREIGVRLALGAGSWRVVRLEIFEALWLSGLGLAGGYLLAMWLLPSATRLLAPGQNLAVGIGGRSIAIMAALALFTALLSALVPALWISRVQPLNALAGNRGLGHAPVQLGRFLVVAQFAIAVTLVALAVALGQEVQRSLAADPGFERERVMTALFDPASAGYERDAVQPLAERLRTALLGAPGVKSVSFAASGILAGSTSTSGIYFRDPRVSMRRKSFQRDSVLPGYFGTTGMTLLAGRDFSERDGPKAQPVAVVSAAFAREAFGNLDPIGQVFGFDEKPAETDWTVVGIVADVHANAVREAAPAMFYTPASQTAGEGLYFLAVRFEGSEADLRQNLRTILARAEPGLVFTSWKTLQKRMADDLSGDVATTELAAIFGACAVVLAGVGVAGSLGYLVVLRQRELALRMAIGADPSRLMRGVLADAMRLSVIGAAVGLLAVWLVPTLPAVKAVLYDRPGIGPAAAAAAIAFAAAVIAGWFPARRAARIDPMLTLVGSPGTELEFAL